MHTSESERRYEPHRNKIDGHCDDCVLNVGAETRNLKEVTTRTKKLKEETHNAVKKTN